MQTAATPPRVLGLYDRPMWDLLAQTGHLHLQRCTGCGTWRYPPGPACPSCLEPGFEWRPVAGGGEILSWVMFRKDYLAAYPAPYNVVAVRLDEGPIVISNLVEDPEASVIGRRVQLTVQLMNNDVALPRFVLEDASAPLRHTSQESDNQT